VPGSSSIFGGASNSLAITLDSFVFDGIHDGPGIISGVVAIFPSVQSGVDIYFNTSQQLGILASNPTAQDGAPVRNPEPGTLVLLASGIAGLFVLRRKNRFFH